MTTRHTTTLLAACVVSLGASVTRADPIDAARVPENANWVVHFDLDAARESTVAERIRSNEKLNEKIGEGFDWLEQRYGIARGDLHGLTFYGESYEPNTGVALLHADYEPKKVEQVVQDEPKYRTARHGEFTLHTWTARDDADTKGPRDDEAPEGDDYAHEVTAVFLDGLVIMGSSPQLVQAALDRQKENPQGRTGNRASREVLGTQVPQGAIMFGTATDLGEIRGNRPDFPELKLVEATSRVTFAAGERGENLFATFGLQMTDEEVATEIRDVAEGLRAFASLVRREAEAQGEEFPFGEEALRLLTIEVEQQGTNVSVRWQANADEVVNAVEQAAEQGIRFDGRKQDVEVEDVEPPATEVDPTTPPTVPPPTSDPPKPPND